MAEPKTSELMEKIVSLCKRRGFVFQSSEIYGGLNGFWDYGPLGAELKRNIKDCWWRSMLQLRDDALNAAVLFDEAIDDRDHFGTHRSTQQSVEQSHVKTLLRSDQARLESTLRNQRSPELEREHRLKRKYEIDGGCRVELVSLSAFREQVANFLEKQF